ncbi:PHP domain-containing protein [Alloscardovia venturai]|uniref:PHP domain-containing protein n=1 Tax=Alloscardovia venturai TaxID=1769421 RepID=A0ABW2Y642_9BIFI
MTVSRVSGWDLHCHTVFSDGTKTPTELIELAHAAGLEGVAISDHDTIAGWQEAKAAAQAKHFPLIRGTEITAEHLHTSVHILAYLYDCEDKGVLDMYAKMRQRRYERAQRMVERLSHDFPITWQSVSEQVREGEATTIGRPHIADALVSAGVYKTRSDAFAGAINGKSPYYVPVDSLAATQVIFALKQAGGVVVLAHCGAVKRNRRRMLTDDDIELFAREYGLDGLEVYHRENSREQQERLSAIAQKLGLLQTGGSDWHGEGKPNVLGENRTDTSTVQEIIRRGRIRLIN